MKLLRRMLLLLFCAGLLAATVGTYSGMTQGAYGHDMYYIQKWPGLHTLREWCLDGVLAWCIVFAKSEPQFVRLGLISVVVAFAFLALPHRLIKPGDLPRSLDKLHGRV